MSHSDVELIAAVLNGDVRPFGELVRRHQQAIALYLWNLLGHHHDCEELTQDAFLQAFRKLSRYDSAKASFRTWVMVIARNKAFSTLAKKSPDLVDELPDTPRHDDPAAATTAAEWRESLDQAMSQLPLAQRSAFIMAEIQELPYAEIAEIEDVEIGTIKSRVARAKAALRTRVPKTI